MPTHPASPPLGYIRLVATCGAATTLLAISTGTTYPAAAPGVLSISSDWGSSWKPVGTLYNSQDSASAACSADGATLAVVESYAGGANPTRASVSTNSGAVWSTTQFSYPTNFCAIASSADGRRLALALSGHGIYVLQSTPVPELKISSRAPGLHLSWLVPSRLFVVQESPDLSLWTDVETTAVLNYTNLHHEMELPRPIGPKFYRLVSH